MVGALAGLGAVLGLVVGSFLNVVAYRVPLGKSIVRPPSACPRCNAPIRPYDNIPVLSWVLLRGKCRDCGAPISVRYPLVETITAVLFALVPIVIGVEWAVAAYWVFVAVTIAVTITDLDLKLIPNRILFPGTALAAALLVAGALLDGALPAAGRAALGGVAYFAGMLVLALGARGGLGFGDVKLAFLLGTFLAYREWDILAVGAFLAFLLGGVISLLLLVFRIKGRKDAIPFGPYLVIGAYLALGLGEAIADWYAGLA